MPLGYKVIRINVKTSLWGVISFFISQICSRSGDDVSKHRNTVANLKLCIAMCNFTLSRSELLFVVSFIVFDIQCGHF